MKAKKFRNKLIKLLNDSYPATDLMADDGKAGFDLVVNSIEFVRTFVTAALYEREVGDFAALCADFGRRFNQSCENSALPEASVEAALERLISVLEEVVVDGGNDLIVDSSSIQP